MPGVNPMYETRYATAKKPLRSRVRNSIVCRALRKRKPYFVSLKLEIRIFYNTHLFREHVPGIVPENGDSNRRSLVRAHMLQPPSQHGTYSQMIHPGFLEDPARRRPSPWRINLKHSVILHASWGVSQEHQTPPKWFRRRGEFCLAYSSRTPPSASLP